MSKTNRFHIKKIEDEVNVTIEEERKDHSPFYLLLKRNQFLIYMIVLMLSLIVSSLTIYVIAKNIDISSVVEYEWKGVVVTFEDGNKSVIDGTPITKEYASKLFDTTLLNERNRGAVIKVKETKFDEGTIVFYSDKTVLIKYKNGNYVKVKPFGNEYGVEEDGTIKAGADSRNVSYESKDNESLGIKLLYLSDGTVEITKGDAVFLLRNDDLTSGDNTFYTNLSMISVPVQKDNNQTVFSDGTVKEDNYIIVNGEKHYPTKEETIHDNIKIIYYDNGYAEVIQDDLDIIVQKGDHIKYDDNIFEIIDDNKEVNIEDFINIKTVELSNKNDTEVKYTVVLEETSDYAKHNVNRRLANEYIDYSIYAEGKKIDGTLNNNLKFSSEYNGIDKTNNTYLLYEGTLKKLETSDIQIGFWVSYENITNEYMNSAFIGTLKIYME